MTKRNEQVELILHTGDTILIHDKHRKFAQLYATENTGSDSYRKAVNPKLEPQAAANGAYKLLKRDEVQVAVEHYRYLASQKISLSEGAIMCEIGAIATYNLADCMDADGNFLSLKDLPLTFQKAIKKFEVTKNKDGSETYKYEFWSKTDMLKTIAGIKNFGHINKQHTVIINNK